MKRILFAAVAAAILFLVIRALLPILSSTPADRDGVSAPSVYHIPAAPGGESTTLLYYTGSSIGQGSALLTVKLTGTDDLKAVDRERSEILDGVKNCNSVQQADPDHFYFVMRDRNNNRGQVLYKHRKDGEWINQEKP